MASIQKIAVVGAGTMGSGIAQVAACAGRDVTLIDVADAALQRAKDGIGKSLGRLVAKEKLSQADADAALARIATKADLGAAKAGQRGAGRGRWRQRMAGAARRAHADLEHARRLGR